MQEKHVLSNKSPLRLKIFIKKLSLYGIKVMEKRGKGSELILIKPESPNSKKGLQYPIKNHGMGTEISLPVISAALRRFKITDFWD